MTIHRNKSSPTNSKHSSNSSTVPDTVDLLAPVSMDPGFASATLHACQLSSQISIGSISTKCTTSDKCVKNLLGRCIEHTNTTHTSEMINNKTVTALNFEM